VDDSVPTQVRELGDRPFRNGFLVTFGLSYWFTALLRPDVVSNLDGTVSAAALVAMGALVLGNLLADSDVLWGLLAVFMTSGIVSSWAGITRSTVPYSAAAAALSMAAVNAVAAVVLFATALDE
jgi:hypothetical protein